jgi:hypothetical protein
MKDQKQERAKSGLFTVRVRSVTSSDGLAIVVAKLRS